MAGLSHVGRFLVKTKSEPTRLEGNGEFEGNDKLEAYPTRGRELADNDKLEAHPTRDVGGRQ